MKERKVLRKSLSEMKNFSLKLMQKEIIREVKKLHSYSVPCVIFFDIKNGNKDFLKWIKQSVT